MLRASRRHGSIIREPVLKHAQAPSLRKTSCCGVKPVANWAHATQGHATRCPGGFGRGSRGVVAHADMSGLPLQHLTLAQIDGSSVALLPALLLGAGLFVLAFRVWCSSQVEYVTAAMLSRNLPKSPIKIIQLGGGTRELFYYPREAIQVTAIGEDLNPGLMGQAGVQAALPVVCRQEPLSSLSKLGGSSADAIVCLSCLHKVGDLRAFFSSAQRVLSPGGRLIFVQPVTAGGSTPFQALAGTSGSAISYDALSPLKSLPGFTSVAWDVANESVDPHAVGLAIKSAPEPGKAKRNKRA